MVEDYRRTAYEPDWGDISAKKNTLVSEIKSEHPHQRDMHNLVSVNDSVWKRKFMQVYNGKCAYCGVSLDIAPQRYFEVDHFIYQKHPRFEGSKAKAGYMGNLVLACNLCNRNKSDIDIPDDTHTYLHPDKPGFSETFIRDADYYIRVSENKIDDEKALELYHTLKLDAETRRLDYLLMSMKGFRSNINEMSPAYKCLADAIDLLQRKRNEFS